MELSNSRIYIFKILYKQKKWFEILDTNALSGLMANILSHGIPELQYKNIQFINTYEDEKYSCEIHINKLKYKGRRTIEKKDIKILRDDLITQFRKINNFSFEQLHIINDEFSRQPSVGFLTEDMFYV